MGRIAGNGTSKEGRHPTDNYPTDPRWTRALLGHVELRGSVWEPAAGDGAMVRALEEHRYEVRATDLTTGHDFLLTEDRAGTVVTNPPYKVLTEFALKGLRQADELLCLLVGWHLVAGGAKRVRELWRAHPPNRVVVIGERMVVAGAASQFNHAWVVWDLKRPKPPGGRADLAWHLAKGEGRTTGKGGAA